MTEFRRKPRYAPTSLSVMTMRKSRRYDCSYNTARNYVARSDVQLNPKMIDELEALVVDISAPENVPTRRTEFGTGIRPKKYVTKNGGSWGRTKGYLFTNDGYSREGLYVMRVFDSEDERKRFKKRTERKMVI